MWRIMHIKTLSLLFLVPEGSVLWRAAFEVFHHARITWYCLFFFAHNETSLMLVRWKLILLNDRSYGNEIKESDITFFILGLSALHMDEFIDEILHEERVCDIILPRIQVNCLQRMPFLLHLWLATNYPSCMKMLQCLSICWGSVAAWLCAARGW